MTLSPHEPGGRGARRRRWARARRWAVGIALVLIAAVAVVVGVIWWLVRSEPTWWRSAPAPSPRAQEVGREVENAVVNHLHAQRTGEEPWSVSISAADANDWLAARLVKWLSSRDPRTDWQAFVGQTVVDFRDGRVFIGSSVKSDPGATGQIVSAVFVPVIDDQGRLWLSAEELTLGRLGVPGSLVSGDPKGFLMRWVADELGESEAAGTVMRAISGEAPLATDPVVTLADKRRVRLVGVAARDGRLELTCRTLAAGTR